MKLGGTLLTAAALGGGLTAFFLALPTPARVSKAAPDGAAEIASAKSPATRVLAIRDVRAFDGEKVREKVTVVVSDGRILAIGDGITPPAGATVIDGAGKTLLPGLIDAHTHTFGTAREDALRFGVTTELDMFTTPSSLPASRKEREERGPKRAADLFSAGVLATAPGGHGTEFGVPIPTLSRPGEAAAFVDARLAEGSDFLKIVLEDGATFGASFASLDEPTLRALVEAAHGRKKLAVVHVSSLASARQALAAGADGLVHAFADVEADEELVALAKARKAFVVPTLTVLEGFAGAAGGGKALGDDPLLSATQKQSLRASFRHGHTTRLDLAAARSTVRKLHAAGVPILAGTDAPNPGTAHGISLHRELELLVAAGLTPVEALAAATSVPARRFDLPERGRLAAGYRADMVLVSGDPTRDILATRAIAAIWKDGHLVERAPGRQAAAAVAAIPEGVPRVGTFDDGTLTAPFGAGWHAADDRRMGGTSVGRMEVASGGAAGTAGALRITGELKPGSPFPWAGAYFFPGREPMGAADLSKKTALVFWARGDGRTYHVNVFAESTGPMPVQRPFPATAEWRQITLPLADFPGVETKAIRGIGFAAGPELGAFRLEVDEVELR